jgi:hypothetical protein
MLTDADRAEYISVYSTVAAETSVLKFLEQRKLKQLLNSIERRATLVQVGLHSTVVLLLHLIFQ